MQMTILVTADGARKETISLAIGATILDVGVIQAYFILSGFGGTNLVFDVVAHQIK